MITQARNGARLAALVLSTAAVLAGCGGGGGGGVADRSLLWGNQVHWYQDGIWRSGAW